MATLYCVNDCVNFMHVCAWNDAWVSQKETLFYMKGEQENHCIP